MSRIGQKIIELPDNVEANLGQDEIKLTGPKGELSAPIFEGANIEIVDKTITVNKGEDNQDFLKNWGLQRTLISNSIIGVSEGFSTTDYENGRSEVQIDLKYHEGEPVIREITRVSKPGRRVYSSVSGMNLVRNGLGISILSTPKGVMSDKSARNNNVGGEVLCTVF